MSDAPGSHDELEPGRTHPVVVLQWGNPEIEGDDYEEIVAGLEVCLFGMDQQKMAAECPRIYHNLVSSDRPEDFLAAIKEALFGNPDVQFVFISAHGDPDGEHLLFSKDGPSRVSMHQIGELFNSPRLWGDTHVVFGACYSMDRMKRTERHMGAAARWVIGFTHEPSSHDVAALMAGVIADAFGLFQRLSAAQRDVLAQGAAAGDPQRFSGIAKAVAEAFKTVVGAHEPNEAQYVVKPEGLSVIVAERDEENGGWNHRVIPLFL